MNGAYNNRRGAIHRARSRPVCAGRESNPYGPFKGPQILSLLRLPVSPPARE